MVSKYSLVCAALLGLAQGAMADGVGETVVVETLSQHSQVVLGGTVVPQRQVTVAAQLPGIVEFIAGSEGDRFAKSAALVALDDDELLAERRSVLAQMADADAAMRNAGVQYSRELLSPSSRQTMSGMGIPGMFDQMFTRNFADMMGYQSPGMDRQADLFTRSTQIEQSRNAFMQAQSRLDGVDAKLRDTVGYAPFDGVIVEKLVEVGDSVQPGQPLLRFVDVDSLQIEVQVPARLMSGITEGDEVMARLDVLDLPPVPVRVAQIFPMADALRHTVTVKFDLPAARAAATSPAGPGMYAEVRIPDPNARSLQMQVIPESALVRRGSLPAVFVVGDEGKLAMRVVRVGEALGDGRIVVLSGLEGGERVVRHPRPGMTSSQRGE